MKRHSWPAALLQPTCLGQSWGSTFTDENSYFSHLKLIEPSLLRGDITGKPGWHLSALQHRVTHLTGDVPPEDCTKPQWPRKWREAFWMLVSSCVRFLLVLICILLSSVFRGLNASLPMTAENDTKSKFWLYFYLLHVLWTYTLHATKK